MKKITILIPCYNEEKGVAKVIKHVPKKILYKLGYAVEIIVIDNNSSDNTAKVAWKNGAVVVSEKKQGKGCAIRTGFRSVSQDTDFVIMLDGDNTYKPKEIPRMVEPLRSGFCDVIIGSRLEGKIRGSSLSMSHRVANWYFTFFARRFYQTNMTDTCTGYFAWKKKVIDKLVDNVESPGFAIEAEMITKMARMGYRIYSVPITYQRREGESKLSPFRDGARIAWMLMRNLTWKPKQENVEKFRRFSTEKV